MDRDTNKMTGDILLEMRQARRQRRSVFKIIKEKKMSLKILYSRK